MSDESDGQSTGASTVIKRLTSVRTPVTRKEASHVKGGSCLEANLDIAFPEGCYLTKGATSKWQVTVFERGGGN